MIRRALFLLAMIALLAACRQQQKNTHAEWKGGKTATSTATGTVPTDMTNKRVTATIKPLAAGFFDRAAIGTVLAKDGTVLIHTTSFVEGDPVYLTMRFLESPVGLQASVRILDSNGKELHREFKDMNGQKIVTFAIPKDVTKKPGTYKVEGYWGGNDSCDYKIDVLKKKR